MSEEFSWFNYWGLLIGELVMLSLAIVIMFILEARKRWKSSAVPQEVEEKWQLMIDLVKKNPQIFIEFPQALLGAQPLDAEQQKLLLMCMPAGWGIGWGSDSQNAQRIMILRENDEAFQIVREYILPEAAQPIKTAGPKS